jgi:hypothetical protein
VKHLVNSYKRISVEFESGVDDMYFIHLHREDPATFKDVSLFNVNYIKIELHIRTLKSKSDLCSNI